MAHPEVPRFFQGRVKFHTSQGTVEMNVFGAHVLQGREIVNQGNMEAEGRSSALEQTRLRLQEIRETLEDDQKGVSAETTRSLHSQLARFGKKSITTIFFPTNPGEVRIHYRLTRNRIYTKADLLKADFNRLKFSGKTLQIATAIRDIVVAEQNKGPNRP